MFKGLATVGGILQVVSIIILVLGVAVGTLVIATASSNVFITDVFAVRNLGVTYIISSILSGLILYGIGASMRALASIARDARRTANALERLAYQQRQQSSAPSRVRQLGQNE